MSSRDSAPPEEARAHLLESLSDAITLHDESSVLSGRRVAGNISQLRWNSEARRFSCSLPGNPPPSEHRVVVDLPRAIGDSTRVNCTCLESRNGGHCEHTWAALTRFTELIHHHDSANVRDPLIEDVLRLDTRPAWARMIDGFDRYLPEEEEEAVDVETQKRLAWRIAVRPRELLVTAWEQRPRQAGGWTLGRRVGWERLRDAPELWSGKADRRAAQQIIARDNVYGADSFTWDIDSFAAIKALIRHPLIFDDQEPDRLLKVARVELGLRIADAPMPAEPGSLMLDAAVNEEPLRLFPREDIYEDDGGRGLVIYDRPGKRLLVAPTHMRVLNFVRSLEGRPRIVPPEGREELLRRLSRLESLLPVWLPVRLIGESREADQRLFLRLSPGVPSGLSVQVRVRPAPNGPYHAPSEGPLRLTGLDQGRRVAVVRDWDDELKGADDLIMRLSLEQWDEEKPWQWRLPGDDDALDFILSAQRENPNQVVVEWPAGGQLRVASPITAGSLRVEIEDRSDWFSLRGGVDIDGWQLSLLDLMLALRRGRRYVPVGEDRWAEIAEDFRGRLKALDDVVHIHRNRLDVDATGLPVLRGLAGDESLASTSERFWEFLGRLDDMADLPTNPPAALRATLRSYQQTGFGWMRRLSHWGVGACLADDMGLGKTVQSIAILLDRAKTGPALVVAPTSLGFNWVREIERFAPTLRVFLYRDLKDREGITGNLGPHDILVITYGLLTRDIERLSKVRWGTMALDEAQAIKNAHTKTAQAVRKINADWSLALTGTPIENHLGELWSLFRTISPGLFGSWKRFRERFAQPIEKEHDKERQTALSQVVRPFILRRTKMEVLKELPPRTEVELYAELSDAERDLYEDTRMKALMQLADVTDAPEQRFQVLAALTRLRQIACHAALVESDWTKPSAKASLFLEVLDELQEGGHRALVFSQFTRHLELIRELLDEREIHYQYLDGQTPIKQRMRSVDAFQDGEGDIFLISLMAGGVGLNLTTADYVIHMDPWWNPAIEDQATDRAHRMGQKKPVTVYRLVAKDTIEEEILSLHADKRDLVAGVLDGADQAANLSTSELVGLIQSGGLDEDEEFESYDNF